MQETKELQVWSLGLAHAPEKETATYSSIHAWKNPMDRGAWWATVQRVAKSRTWMNDWACIFFNQNPSPFAPFVELGWFPALEIWAPLSHKQTAKTGPGAHISVTLSCSWAKMTHATMHLWMLWAFPSWLWQSKEPPAKEKDSRARTPRAHTQGIRRVQGLGSDAWRPCLCCSTLPSDRHGDQGSHPLPAGLALGWVARK